jgi:phage-related protein
MNKSVLSSAIDDINKHLRTLEYHLHRIKPSTGKDVKMSKSAVGEIKTILDRTLLPYSNSLSEQASEENTKKSLNNFLKINSPSEAGKREITKIFNLKKALVLNAKPIKKEKVRAQDSAETEPAGKK